MSNLVASAFGGAIKTQYERRLLSRALPRLCHGRFCESARITRFGSYELRRWEALTAQTTALTEATTPTELTAPSLTQVTITPLFYGAWIGFSDKLELEAMDPVVLEVSGILGEQAGLSADVLYRDAMVTGATKDYSGDQAANTTLSYPQHLIAYVDFVKQIAALEGANAQPVDGEDYVTILHPYTWASLMLDPVFVQLFERANEQDVVNPIRTGYVGRILRTKIFVSSNGKNLGTVGVGSANVYSMLVFGKQAYGSAGITGAEPPQPDNFPDGYANMTGQKVMPVEIILHDRGTSGVYDPMNMLGTIAWKFSLAIAILNSAWIRDCQHVNEFAFG